MNTSTRQTKNLDPSDPTVRAALNAIGPRTAQAYELAQPFGEAVRPIFSLDGSGRRLEQVGSCVLFTINRNVFALSAAHVFELVGDYRVPIGCGDRVHYLSGERFSSKRDPAGTHRDDPVDVAVFHIQEPVPDSIRFAALTSEHLDLSPPGSSLELCAAIGFRAKRSSIVGKSAYTDQDILVSLEVGGEDYEKLAIDPQRFLATAYDTEVLVEGRWQTSPSPKGMSGGAILRIDGLRAIPGEPSPRPPKALLSAITTELRRKRKETPQVLIGARIGFHLGLIYKYLPGGLDGLVEPAE